MSKRPVPIRTRAIRATRTTKGLFLVLLVSLQLALTGCAGIDRFTAEDAGSAAEIAATVGDPAGAACWPVFTTTANALAASGGRPGILTTIEQSRAVQMAISNPACQQILAGVATKLLKLFPADVFVP
jgi:hypothetical protein